MLTKENAQLKNWEFYLADSLRTWAYYAVFQIVLRDCSEEVMKEPEYIGVFQQKPDCGNIKQLLLVKEN